MAIAYLATLGPAGGGGILISHLEMEWGRERRRWLCAAAENPGSENMFTRSAGFLGQLSSWKPAANLTGLS